ncbi:MAG: DUF58 domain-containing protein [Betaproteobacteria bacterium]
MADSAHGAGVRPPHGDGVRPGLGAGVRAAVDAERLLRRLEWTVIRRLEGALQGDYRTLFRGFGMDFADLHEYQADDDVRYIDWNVTARMQVPYVREFQEDREVAAWFLVDLSGSLDFGSQGVRKAMLATDFVAVLARVLTRRGNRVGAVFYRGTGRAPGAVVPARGGRMHVLHMLDSMLRPPAGKAGPRLREVSAAYETGSEGGHEIAHETDLGELLARAQPAIKRRAAVFLISDFVSRPGWERALGMLARRHEITAVRLCDPLERALPDLGMVVMQDAESGEQLFVDTHDRGFRARFAKAAAEREQGLRDALARAGVDCLELSTDGPIDGALLRFSRMRKQRSQLAAGASPAAAAAKNA